MEKPYFHRENDFVNANSAGENKVESMISHRRKRASHWFFIGKNVFGLVFHRGIEQFPLWHKAGITLVFQGN
jgi:hypothetical protein